MLAISSKFMAGAYSFIRATIDGKVIPMASGDNNSGQTWMAGTIIVPINSTYSLSIDAGSLNAWYELR